MNVRLFGTKVQWYLKKKQLALKTDKHITIDMDGEHLFFPESEFKRMLILERKRTERSLKPFLFVMIEIQDLLKAGVMEHDLIGKKMSTVLASISREIDYKGWYVKNKVIGIVYTEINLTSKECILTKIHSGLNSVFDSMSNSHIRVNMVVFPEKEIDSGISLQDRPVVNDLYNSVNRKLTTRIAVSGSKRVLDVIGSIFLILLASPIMVLVSILIKLTSRGAVFYKQKRVGIGGEEFVFFKFRTMHANNNDAIHREYVSKFISSATDKTIKQDGVFKIKNDPRITKIGGFLRKWSIDELPQLFNVLMGDMSLVGPRPPLKYEVDQYQSWHRQRLFEVKPGLTGKWQVEGRCTTRFDEMIRMDIQYIKRLSLWRDIAILIKTPLAVIIGKGAR